MSAMLVREQRGAALLMFAPRTGRVAKMFLSWWATLFWAFDFS